MKKFFLLSAFVLGSIASTFAQTPAVQTLAQSGDTVTNAETEYLTITLTGNYEVVTFQYVQVKLSGTVAGTATLQASLTGTYWVDLDTITNTNTASQTAFFSSANLEPNRYKYYRVACTGTGTMATRVYAYCLPKPK